MASVGQRLTQSEDSHLDARVAEKFPNFILPEVIHNHEQIASTGTIETQP